jgi:hypothetical protein
MSEIVNPGRDAPIPRCHRQCGQLMEAFDALPYRLRRFFDDEVLISWCTCGALALYREQGEAKTLARYRALERRHRDRP